MISPACLAASIATSRSRERVVIAAARINSGRGWKPASSLTERTPASTDPRVRALAMFVATAGGLGYAPVAPGTFGSLVGVPLVPALAALDDRAGRFAYAVVIVLLVAMS